MVPSFTHITPVLLAGTAHKGASPGPEVTGGAILTSGDTRSAEAGREPSVCGEIELLSYRRFSFFTEKRRGYGAVGNRTKH